MAKKKARGPLGGIKHQPGRGHDRKSGLQRQRRFARKAIRLRQQEEEEIRKQWEVWDKLTEEQKKLLPKLRPKAPREGHDH